MERITATYHVTRPDRPLEALARAITLEQTVEAAEDLVSPDIEARFVGRIDTVEPVGTERFEIRIAYPLVPDGFGLGALLQTVYGNVSFYRRIRLVGLDLPLGAWKRMPTGRGAGAVREWTGVRERALLGAVLKPRGLEIGELARRAGAFAAGGGDVLKDDQNLLEDFDGFRQRVEACHQAVEAACAGRAGKCLYLPHVAGAGEALEKRLAFVRELGLAGVVMCGFVMGLEQTSMAAARHGLMWMCHPALAGAWTEPETHGIAPKVVFGTLVRAAGAAICNFPVSGGRVGMREAADREIIDQLTRPIADRPAALPCLAGGVALDRLESLAEENGPDCMLLVGSDLMRAGDGLEETTARAIETLRQAL